MKRGLAVVLVACALLTGLLDERAYADESSGPTTRQSFTIDHSDLVLEVPTAWKQLKPLQLPGKLNLKFVGDEAVGPYSVQISGAVIPPEGRRNLEPDNLKKQAHVTAGYSVAKSVEKQIELHEIKGETAIAYWFTLTDGSPNPGKYKVMTGAAVAVSDVLLNVTILHQKGSQQQAAALAMLKTASLLNPAPAPATQPSGPRAAGPSQ